MPWENRGRPCPPAGFQRHIPSRLPSPSSAVLGSDFSNAAVVSESPSDPGIAPEQIGPDESRHQDLNLDDIFLVPGLAAPAFPSVPRRAGDMPAHHDRGRQGPFRPNRGAVLYEDGAADAGSQVQQARAPRANARRRANSGASAESSADSPFAAFAGNNAPMQASVLVLDDFPLEGEAADAVANPVLPLAAVPLQLSLHGTRSLMPHTYFYFDKAAGCCGDEKIRDVVAFYRADNQMAQICLPCTPCIEANIRCRHQLTSLTLHVRMGHFVQFRRGSRWYSFRWVHQNGRMMGDLFYSDHEMPTPRDSLGFRLFQDGGGVDGDGYCGEPFDVFIYARSRALDDQSLDNEWHRDQRMGNANWTYPLRDEVLSAFDLQAYLWPADGQGSWLQFRRGIRAELTDQPVGPGPFARHPAP